MEEGSELDAVKMDKVLHDLVDEGIIAKEPAPSGYMSDIYDLAMRVRFTMPDYTRRLSIKNTVCGANIPGAIIKLIRTFVDWSEYVKFAYFTNAQRREIQVV
jgi:hypothetical protein